MSPDGLNQYLSALWSVGQVIQDYDTLVEHTTTQTAPKPLCTHPHDKLLRLNLFPSPPQKKHELQLLIWNDFILNKVPIINSLICIMDLFIIYTGGSQSWGRGSIMGHETLSLGSGDNLT